MIDPAVIGCGDVETRVLNIRDIDRGGSRTTYRSGKIRREQQAADRLFIPLDRKIPVIVEKRSIQTDIRHLIPFPGHILVTQLILEKSGACRAGSTTD